MALVPDPIEEFQHNVAGANVHDFTVRDIDGNEVSLSRYRGEVLLIVNTASLCANATQFHSLESLYRKFKGKGLRVLAFPSPSFGKEPRHEPDIKRDCVQRFHATFDLFGKVAVIGRELNPLYAFLTSKEKNPAFGGAIDHNFTKFLVGRDGRVIGRFKAFTDPLTPEVIQSVERALTN